MGKKSLPGSVSPYKLFLVKVASIMVSLLRHGAVSVVDKDAGTQRRFSGSACGPVYCLVIASYIVLPVGGIGISGPQAEVSKDWIPVCLCFSGEIFFWTLGTPVSLLDQDSRRIVLLKDVVNRGLSKSV